MLSQVFRPCNHQRGCKVIDPDPDLLEFAAYALLDCVRVLRGEKQDLTNLGLWLIFVQNLEKGGHVKVLTLQQYELLKYESEP